MTTHTDPDHALTALAIKIIVISGLLLPLDAPGCDGVNCSRPAFRDRSTGIWRHLRDLSRCHADRRNMSGEATADATIAEEGS